MQINKVLLENHPDQNFTVGREGHSITGIIIHTMVGTIDSAQSRFSNPAQQVTVHYGVALSGEIREWVQEANTAWQAGNWQVNLTTVGIEHEDNGNAGDSVRTEAEYNSSSDLVADICRRYGIPCDRSHIRKHSEVIDRTAYPGGTGCCDGLDIDRIVREAAAKLGGAPAPAPAATPTPQIGYTPLNRAVTVSADTLMVRSGPGTEFPGGQANTSDGNLHSGDNIQITGWTTGQSVVNNDIWLRSVYGHWLWSGGTNFDLSLTKPAPAAPAPTAVPVTAVIPAPAPTPAPAPKSHITYEKLAKPLELVAKTEPTRKWDLGFAAFAEAKTVAELPVNTPFVAYGKAQRTDLSDKPVYYMTQEDFGDADTSGTPNNDYGINTVDLAPAPVVAPTPVAPPAPATASVSNDAALPSGTTDTVPVTVTPTDPNAWKTVTRFLSPQEFKANANTKIYELDTSIPITDAHPQFQQLVKDQPITIAGWFIKDKLRYYISLNSLNAHPQTHYYGIPEAALRQSSISATGGEIDTILHELENDVEPVLKTAKAIERLATANGLVTRVLRRTKK